MSERSTREENITEDTDPTPRKYVDPIIEAYKKDVDRSILRENLRLTVDQRFRKFAEFVKYACELRDAGNKHRSTG